MSDDPRDGVTWFGVTSGRVTGILGLVVGVIVTLIGISQESAAGAVVGLLVGLLTWLVLLRPRVGTRGTDLLLRGIVSTVVVPLASIESIAIRQVLAVWADGRRYVNPAIGHTLREINRQRRGGGQVENIPVEQSKYADQVHEIILERSRSARRDGAPMGPVRREWAWPEIGALAVLVVAFVVALAVA
jgi:hypothetical protein